MTYHRELQRYLAATGRYPATEIDGIWGPKEQGAILMALQDGPDTALTDEDFAVSAKILRVAPSSICAFAEVEAAGAGFHNGFPKILPEPHCFSKLTHREFDGTHPAISYVKWGTRPYPATQEERYDLLLRMVRLNVDAGFAACSYGKFQILGSNHAACGYDSSWGFAFAMARDEQTQLRAFEKFILNSGIVDSLRACRWSEVAKRYNGPAYLKNRYDVKLAQAARKHAMRLGE